jgi:Ca2+-binding RTX toxin-like protein
MMHRVHRARPMTALTLVTTLCWTPGASPADGHTDAARQTCRGQAATILGTPGNDDIIGTPKADVIVGGDGNDRIDGGRGNDIICGGRSGLRVSEGESDPQWLSGGPGNDVVVGGPGWDALDDSGGSDVLIGGAGGDILTDYDRRAGRDDADVLRGGAGADAINGSRGLDRLYGGAGNDFFRDPLGENVFRGGGGDDRFDTGAGNETIIGGPGADSANYVVTLRPGSSSSHCNDVTANLSTGIAFGNGFGVDSLKGIENLASGGGQDVLIGDSGNNTFYVGMACPGALVQRDSVAGGAGWDRISFDSNEWDYGSSFGPVAVDLSAGTAEQHNSSPLIETAVSVALDSVENVTGTEYEDTMLGDDRPNRFSAGPSTYSNGGDVMRGRGGDDRLTGSVGPDEIFGDEGADELVGREGNDRLDGGTGANTVDGGKGRDTCQNPDRYNGALDCES